MVRSKITHFSAIINERIEVQRQKYDSNTRLNSQGKQRDERPVEMAARSGRIVVKNPVCGIRSRFHQGRGRNGGRIVNLWASNSKTVVTVNINVWRRNPRIKLTTAGSSPRTARRESPNRATSEPPRRGSVADLTYSVKFRVKNLHDSGQRRA